MSDTVSYAVPGAAGIPQQPLVSCVVITRNRQAELPGCLESLRRQSYRPLEWIVVDNASTDGSGDLVREQFPDVQLIELSANQGVPGARNRGVAAAGGSLVLFLDDDARLETADAVAQAVEMFIGDDRLACVSFKICAADSGDEERRSIPRTDKRPADRDYEAAYFCGTAFVVRRDAFLAAGGFWEPLVYSGEEIDLSYRWLEQGWRIMHSRRIVALHRHVATARPSGQYVYYNLRARCWVALRNLPWRYTLSTALAWWLHAGWMALRQGAWGGWLRGTRDAVASAPQAWRTRRVIGRSTVQSLRKLSGRLWY